jgi:hypothetical protein
MHQPQSVTSRIRYGRKLVRAGISGIRSGQQVVRGEQRLASLAADAARNSLALAAVGACVGLLRSYFTDRHNRVSSAVVFGTLGGALGFCAGFGWKTRKLTSGLAQSAVREVGKARDEHWLESNPIDYA